jgi:hypothetical protein
MGERTGRALSGDPGGRFFWICLVIGWLVILYGILGLFDTAARTNPEQWIRWFLGSLVVHDFVLAPLTIAAGALLVKRVHGPHRGPLQAGLILTAIVVLTVWPLLRGYGLRDDNPSALPNNYLAGLVLVLVVVWSAVVVVVARSRKRS